jgi:hypothetical protein
MYVLKANLNKLINLYKKILKTIDYLKDTMSSWNQMNVKPNSNNQNNTDAQLSSKRKSKYYFFELTEENQSINIVKHSCRANVFSSN